MYDVGYFGLLCIKVIIEFILGKEYIYFFDVWLFKCFWIIDIDLDYFKEIYRNEFYII